MRKVMRKGEEEIEGLKGKVIMDQGRKAIRGQGRVGKNSKEVSRKQRK